MGRILTGQVAIVTGASSGIGAATAVAMARAGMDLLLAARRQDRLAAVAQAVESVGRRARVLAVDVSQRGSERLILDEAQRHFGRFDVVFANAGFGLERDVHLTQDEELRILFEVNFFASVALLGESARRLRAEGRGGHFLMCSSCLSKFSLPGYGAYAASKAAQESICRAMRFELLPHGIEVASVHPITTTTEFFAESAARSGTKGGAVPEHAPRWAVQPPERVADAIVDCLRYPKSEVWTSEIVRLSAALFNACPWILDIVLRREVKRRARQLARDAAQAPSAPRQ
jgi:short-subunit dehydrogenase